MLDSLLTCGSALNIVNRYNERWEKRTLRIALENSLGTMLDKLGNLRQVA